MNSSLLRTSIVALAAALAAAPVLAKDGDKSKTESTKAASSSVIATVNGKAIPKSRVDAIVAAQVAQGHPDTPQLRQQIRDGLIQSEVLLQEAAKKGFDKKPEVRAQMDMASHNVLINAFIGDYVKTHPVTDEALKKEYDSIRSQLGDKEYKARHILVDNEAEAKSIIEKLNKGEKFEDLAKASKDPGSKDHGGDLGWAAPNSYVKPFADAMMKLEKGKYTLTPVKTDFGYHVIQLEDTRELKVPAFDEVKPQLTQRMQQQMVEKFVADLRAKAKVE